MCKAMGAMEERGVNLASVRGCIGRWNQGESELWLHPSVWQTGHHLEAHLFAVNATA